MKKTIGVMLMASVLSFASCTSVKQIGQLNMVSTRNVSMKESYVLIKTYSGGSKRDLKRNKAETIDGAINSVVKTVPGGEFLMNSKIYTVTRFKKVRYGVEGDVYGLAENNNFKGFKKGDHIQWQANSGKLAGIIIDLKNDREATVKQDTNGNTTNVSYEIMNKID